MATSRPTATYSHRCPPCEFRPRSVRDPGFGDTVDFTQIKAALLPCPSRHQSHRHRAGAGPAGVAPPTTANNSAADRLGTERRRHHHDPTRSSCKEWGTHRWLIETKRSPHPAVRPAPGLEHRAHRAGHWRCRQAAAQGPATAGPRSGALRREDPGVAYPDETPEQIIRRLEAVPGDGHQRRRCGRRHRSLPGVGTMAALSAVAGESLFFLEASALLALAVAEVHGIDPADQQRRESLVLAVALGEEGVTALGKILSAAGAPPRSSSCRPR